MFQVPSRAHSCGRPANHIEPCPLGCHTTYRLESCYPNDLLFLTLLAEWGVHNFTPLLGIHVFALQNRGHPVQGQKCRRISEMESCPQTTQWPARFSVFASRAGDRSRALVPIPSQKALPERLEKQKGITRLTDMDLSSWTGLVGPDMTEVRVLIQFRTLRFQN